MLSLLRPLQDVGEQSVHDDLVVVVVAVAVVIGLLQILPGFDSPH